MQEEQPLGVALLHWLQFFGRITIIDAKSMGIVMLIVVTLVTRRLQSRCFSLFLTKSSFFSILFIMFSFTLKTHFFLLFLFLSFFQSPYDSSTHRFFYNINVGIGAVIWFNYSLWTTFFRLFYYFLSTFNLCIDHLGCYFPSAAFFFFLSAFFHSFDPHILVCLSKRSVGYS